VYIDYNFETEENAESARDLAPSVDCLLSELKQITLRKNCKWFSRDGETCDTIADNRGHGLLSTRNGEISPRYHKWSNSSVKLWKNGGTTTQI